MKLVSAMEIFKRTGPKNTNDKMQDGYEAFCLVQAHMTPVELYLVVKAWREAKETGSKADFFSACDAVSSRWSNEGLV